jgi:hypothetical protein
MSGELPRRESRHSGVVAAIGKRHKSSARSGICASNDAAVQRLWLSLPGRQSTKAFGGQSRV